MFYHFSDRVLAFPCQEDHVTCLDCFRQYCLTRLRERQFQQHPEYGYTLICPIGCPDSYIKEVHHFRLLTNSQVSISHLKCLLICIILITLMLDILSSYILMFYVYYIFEVSVTY